MSEDKVNPNHYNKYDMSTYDMMKKIWGPEKLLIYCEINAFKYRMRAGDKIGENIMIEFNKAKWYELKAKELKKEIEWKINQELEKEGA